MTRRLKEGKRTFRVVSSSFGLLGGRYEGVDAMEAARKAGRKQFEKAEATKRSAFDNLRVTLELRETTRVKPVNTHRDRYYYEVTRILIPVAERKPQTFKKPDGTTVTFTPKYDYVVKSVPAKQADVNHMGGLSYLGE